MAGYPFYYGEQAKMHSFVRIPKVLLENDAFAKLSAEAKLLYGLLLDRMQLSAKNHWFDEKGRVYIYFKVELIQALLHCSNKTASKILAELDEKSGVGLISRVRQGMGRPDRIYVHKCVTSQIPESGETDELEAVAEETDVKGEADTKGYDQYYEFFTEQLAINALLTDHPDQTDRILEILTLIVETVCTQKPTLVVGGEVRPAGIVKSRLMKLNVEHIRYVLHAMDQNVTDIRNIRQYLLTALYNAPATISSYYAAKVSHDMYG